MPENIQNLTLSTDSPVAHTYAEVSSRLHDIVKSNKGNPPSPEQVKEILGQLERLSPLKEKTLSNVEVQMDRALEIMGKESFFGPESVTKAFGFEIPEHEIPPIPFSDSELKKAKDLGHLLVLRWTPEKHAHKMNAGLLKRIVDNRLNMISGSFELEQHNANSIDLLDPVFSSEVFSSRWALIRPDNSSIKEEDDSDVTLKAFYDYIEYIESVGLKDIPELQLAQCCRKFNIWKRKDEEVPLDELMKLVPFQKFCPTFVEMYYDFLLTYMNNDYQPIYLNGVCSRSLIGLPGQTKSESELATLLGSQNGNHRHITIATVNSDDFHLIVNAFAFSQTEHYYD